MTQSFLRNRTLWAIALAAGVATAGVAAQQPPAPATPAPSPTVSQTPTDRYVVGQATPEPSAGTEMLPLTLEQAINMAIENNLELKVARMAPQMVDYQLQSARAAFRPQFTSSWQYSDRGSISFDALDAVSSFNDRTNNFSLGMNQTTGFLGGRYTANFNSSRQVSTNPRLSFNPRLSAGMSFSYTQPLLRGFKIDNQRNQLRTLAVQRQISDIQLTQTIENTKNSVRVAYWNLRRTIEQIEIQRRSLELASRLLQDNRTKVEIGTLAPIETTTSETQVANAQRDLLNAQIQWRTAELNLRRLLASAPDDPIYRQTINPVDRPAIGVASVDIPAAVQRAVAERTDVIQAKRNLEVTQLNLEVTQNQLKPQLDLQAGYSGSGANRQLPTSEITGYWSALSQLGRLDIPTWNVGFNVTYPLGMQAAKADYARAVVALEQQQAQLKAQELTVSNAVINAGLAVDNTYRQYQAAQVAREAAERNAEAEQTRFDVGMSTNYNVVLAQNNLTSSRLSELTSLINYMNAVAEFDRVQRVGGN
jgi:HAE1 family hydrophobic/amphiphilic exporter-1